MADLKNVIYLSNEDYETLVTTGTVTIGSETLIYDETNNIYVTPEETASATNDGLMSAADKAKLDGIEPGAGVDTNQKVAVGTTVFGNDDTVLFTGTGSASVTANATNKTITITVPTVNNAALTIQKNGTSIATFSANQSTAVTANITVPTTLDEISDGSTRKLTDYLLKTAQAADSEKLDGHDSTYFQTALSTQTAYSAKGSATKVPQITTNNLGQVTGITEVTVTDHNDNQTVKVGSTTFTANAAVSFTGSGAASVSANSSNNTITITVPTVTDTNAYHSTGSWNGLTYTAENHGGAPTLSFTIQTGTSATTVAAGNHTHGYYTKPAGGIPASDLAESYYIKPTGGIPSSDLASIGTAAYKDYTTTVASGNTNVVTSGAVYTAINNLTDKYHTASSDWNGLSYTFVGQGGASDITITLPTGTTSDTVAVGNHTHGYYTKPATGIPAGDLAETYIKTSATGSTANKIPVLDSNGKLPDSTIPAVAITDTYVVASESAMLALAAQKGDIAIRSDLNKSFVLQTTPASTSENWKELLTPTDAVLSVNGKTGAVTLDAADVNALPDSTYLGQQIIVLQDNGSTTAGTWLAKTDAITALAAGQIFLYKVTVAGAATTKLNITCSGTATGAKTIYRMGSTKLTTHYIVGEYILLYFDGTYFKVLNDYDTNTDTKIRQYQKGGTSTLTGDKYPLLAKYVNTSTTSYVASYANYWNDTYLDADTGELYVNNKQVATVDDIPTVNNAALTIQQNGATIATFSANQATAVTASLTDTGATSVTVSGSGNVVNSGSYDASSRTITLTKSVTAITAHQGIKSLNTNNTTSQTVNANEAIAGSGSINLHKIAKTGDYNDLLNQPDIPEPVVEITYSALKTLRDNSQLVPGTWYRITDYQCTTIAENTTSAGHIFDVIVIADSNNKLDERARAILHTGDTYFANNRVEAWQLWYCLDNDTTRFDWADNYGIVVNNIIYTRNPFKDRTTATYGYAWSNGMRYRYTDTDNPTTETRAYSTDSGGTSYRISSIHQEAGKGVIYRMIDEFNNDVPYDFKNILFTTSGKYTRAYTFSYTTNSTIQDVSLSGSKLNKLCHDNIMKEYIYSGTQKQQLNFNVFYSNQSFFDCYFNTFGHNCYSNTFRHQCYGNTFGNQCCLNTFGCICYSNIFKDNCKNNTFSDLCNFNRFEYNCERITLGESCYSNIFGYDCYYITLGDRCSYNKFGNRCSYDTFGNSQSINYCKYIIIEDGCSYLYINSRDTTASDSNYLQNVHIHLGVKGTSSSSRTTITIPDRNLPYETNVYMDTDGNIKMVINTSMIWDYTSDEHKATTEAQILTYRYLTIYDDYSTEPTSAPRPTNATGFADPDVYFYSTGITVADGGTDIALSYPSQGGVLGLQIDIDDLTQINN